MTSCDFCGQEHGPELQHSELQPQKVWAGNLTRIEDFPQAQQIAIDFYNEFDPGHSEKLETMFPTSCSPSGEAPATHRFCWLKATKDQLDASMAFVAKHNHPIVIEFADSKEEFLTRHGLRVIHV